MLLRFCLFINCWHADLGLLHLFIIDGGLRHDSHMFACILNCTLIVRSCYCLDLLICMRLIFCRASHSLTWIRLNVFIENLSSMMVCQNMTGGYYLHLCSFIFIWFIGPQAFIIYLGKRFLLTLKPYFSWNQGCLRFTYFFHVNMHSLILFVPIWSSWRSANGSLSLNTF